MENNKGMKPVFLYAYCIKEFIAVLIWGGLVNWFGMKRLFEAFQEPDANGDGVFTVSDIGAHLSGTFFASGDLLLSWLAGTGFGVFFEMNEVDPNVIISSFINIFAWGSIWAGIYSVYRLARHKKGTVWL
jgi:hypothetical protein